jgi:hypothetical protein
MIALNYPDLQVLDVGFIGGATARSEDTPPL